MKRIVPANEGPTREERPSRDESRRVPRRSTTFHYDFRHVSTRFRTRFTSVSADFRHVSRSVPPGPQRVTKRREEEKRGGKAAPARKTAIKHARTAPSADFRAFPTAFQPRAPPDSRSVSPTFPPHRQRVDTTFPPRRRTNPTTSGPGKHESHRCHAKSAACRQIRRPMQDNPQRVPGRSGARFRPFPRSVEARRWPMSTTCHQAIPGERQQAGTTRPEEPGEKTGVRRERPGESEQQQEPCQEPNPEPKNQSREPKNQTSTDHQRQQIQPTREYQSQRNTQMARRKEADPNQTASTRY